MQGEAIMRVRSIRSRETRPTASERVDSVLASSALTELEAAQYLGMSAAWLKKSRTRRFSGTVDAPPFIRCGARRVVYRREDLDVWLARHIEHVGPRNDSGPDALERASVE